MTDKPPTSSIKGRLQRPPTFYEAAEKYRVLFEDIAQGVFYRRADGVITDCNPATLEILGLNQEQVLGKTAESDSWQVIREDGSPLPDDQRPSMVALRTGKPVRNFVAGFFNPVKGEYVWLNINAIPQFKEGEDRPYQSLVTLHDATHRINAIEALKKSEHAKNESLKLLQLVVDTIPMRLFWKNTDLVYLGCNHLFARDAGFTEPSELIGKDDFSMGWNEQSELYRSDDMEVMRTGKAKLNYEEPQTTPEGKHITLLTSKVPIRNTSDEIIGLLGIYEDITVRKREERELIRMQKLDSLGRLAGGIAHNFNNILMSIIGNISLAQNECPDNTLLSEQLANAKENCMKAKELSQQFLTFSKGGKPAIEVIDAAKLIEINCQLSLSGTTSVYQLFITENLRNIEADAGQISQVLTNLLINADQAMPDGGEIQIHCSNAVLTELDGLPLKNGDYVKITIVDQGEGINDQDLDKIFDPYFTTKDYGTGLGLASAYSIIKQHDGYLGVESTSGSGTTFVMYIPATSAPAKKTVPADSSIIRGEGHILIMDDDRIVLGIVGAMLDHLGYDYEIAEDGETAIALYERAMLAGKPFDLVFVDLIVPNGMGGEETISRLMALDPEVRAIVSSAYSNDPIMANYRSYGFHGILKKPYSLEELSQLLQQSLVHHN